MTPQTESALKELCKQHFPNFSESFTLTKLHGEASNRIYYRLSLKNDQSTYILMQMPAGPASASEEITNAKEAPKEIPFLAVQRYLRGIQLPVPTVMAQNIQEGLILLEDLGSNTFESKVSHLIPDQTEENQALWYRKAIDLLLDWQQKGERPSAVLPHQRSFDATLLNWEFEHFFEYGITARLGIKISTTDKRELDQWASVVTKHLTTLPQTLVHRDYQSRNLMVLDDSSLVIIDFQDALLGPLPYDLVGLLRDSYVVLPQRVLDDMIVYYWQERQKLAPVDSLPLAQFQKDVRWMTIQRKLKDAGRFVYIDQVKHNPSFLPHIPSSLQYVRNAFQQEPELKDFYELLKRYVPEWQTPEAIS